MKKQDLVNLVMHNARISKKDATIAVDTVFEAIISAVSMGEKVQISRFGTFKSKEMKSYDRPSLDNAGKWIHVEERTRPIFKASSSFVDRLNQDEE